MSVGLHVDVNRSALAYQIIINNIISSRQCRYHKQVCGVGYRGKTMRQRDATGDEDAMNAGSKRRTRRDKFRCQLSDQLNDDKEKEGKLKYPNAES